MSKKRNRQGVFEEVQNIIDDLDRAELDNEILQQEKELAQHKADITTQANEELVSEIRKLNRATGLYGVNHVERRVENNRNVSQCSECVNFRSNESKCVGCKFNSQNNMNDKCPECGGDSHYRKVKIESPFSDKMKQNAMFIAGLLIIIVLAIGFTPDGAFWDALQNSWIDLIANVFKLALICLAGALMYFSMKKRG